MAYAVAYRSTMGQHHSRPAALVAPSSLRRRSVVAQPALDAASVSAARSQTLNRRDPADSMARDSRR